MVLLLDIFKNYNQKWIIMRTKNFIAILLLIIGTISCGKDDPNSNSSVLKGIRIGLYIDNGAGGTVEVESMLKQIGCSYSTINKDTILTKNLSNYDIILFPGGDMWVYRSHLTSTGVQKLKEFVQLGGGYIGICAGSYFAASNIIWRGWADEPRQYFTNTGLGIFSGTADGPIDDYAPSYQDPNCKVNINRNHPITSASPQQLDYLYSFGPKYIIADSSGISILGRSTIGNNTVVMAIQYEQGRVFLTALHPEFDDNKTSWGMMKKAILWCSNKL
jgi:glutamine amidotransferase-like uncharacterized protein